MTKAGREAAVADDRQRGLDSLRAAEVLARAGLHHDAISRAYYAAFHFASAALAALGVEATSHRALLSLFSLHVVKPGHVDRRLGSELGLLMSLRHQADYVRFMALGGEAVEEQLERCRMVVDEVDRFLLAQGYDPVDGGS